MGVYSLVSDRPQAKLVAVEKKEPFRCGVWQLSSEVLQEIHSEIEVDLAKLNQCIDSDIWPTGYEAVRHITKG